MTLGELIESVSRQLDNADLFYGHGTDNPLDEACYLIASVVGYTAVYEAYDPDLTIDTGQEHQIRSLVAERITSRKPAAYLVNKAWFAGLEFYVDKHVLIPRSPIAELIEEGFSPWFDPKDIARILDIGTGSGCIAIACAHYLKKVMVDAVDVDLQALDIARRNAATPAVADRIRFIQSDLFQNVAEEHYDLIIANPPYVGFEEMEQLPPEYAHEPVHALQAENDGLALAEVILRQAADHLTENGRLILEVGMSYHALVQRYPDVPFFWFEFERGGEGVCMLDRDELRRWFPV